MPRATKRNGKAKRVGRKPKAKAGVVVGKRRDTRLNQKGMRAARARAASEAATAKRAA